MKRYAYHGTGTDDLSRSPVDIARERAAAYYPYDARDQERFMDEFGRARIAELRGRDTWWHWRGLLELGDSVLIAAWVEGVTSARREGARL